MKETKMDRITTEMAEHICDNLCKHPCQNLDQEELEEICADCELGQYICDILNEHNRQPIAYNLDKVVEQLYELGGVDGFDECAKAYDNAIEDAIKVVKAGGVE